ncbi:hypothetical protein AAG570_003120 [Ranatra chinensis]|uniref:Alpha-mannosidase n=1 Tax=Ranatra chinensis TaxID=642074 RepID=A0ABD0Y810_9HEMI
MGRVYDILKFDNIDGGVWKQGWKITYDEKQWDENNKLNIFVVPHSHNDPGWKKTFEDYYQSQTRMILNNMVKKLKEDERRKFIWAEISFFALWWSEISSSVKDQVKELVSKRQLEFVTGGWVMPDEANSHYYSILEQLIYGHQWLLDNLNYVPRHSWSIDPFGLSPSLPYILKKSGFIGLAVQRSHYSVKKYLAKQKQLEFRWRQLWDEEGGTELLTHMMPFYSYDVPHTCGPDPKICCQFDFKRLPGYGVTCPWKVPPQLINDKNVAQKAALILDQYRKKAQLYSTNVLLVPLGDDFRYDHLTEWDAQFTNYQKLFDYINSNPHMNAKAQFGTLGDYFDALKKEKSVKDFPTLSGDFFTYADRDDHYWSGYYTSRPFYKRMDRVLISYLRMAARKNRTVEAWIIKLLPSLSEARSSLSLFQHHDGITGTSKDHVVNDYASKMLEAIKSCQHIIQQSANFLLFQGNTPQLGDEIFFITDDNRKLPSSLSEQTVLKFPSGNPDKYITFFNPLTSRRKEIVTLKVEHYLIQVRDSNNVNVPFQISPICGVMDSTSKCYQLVFVVDIPPLSLSTYRIEPADDSSDSHATLKFFNEDGNDQKYDWKNKEKIMEREFSIQNDKLSVAFSKLGLLKAVTLKKEDGSITIPIHLSFIRYFARPGLERSGAYLFLPEGEAEIINVNNPSVTIVEGKLMSQVIVRLTNIVHSPDSHGLEIQNVVDIASITDNYELGMRLSSSIKNGDVFYTDLNGIQIIKRKRLGKLPLQGNYYPLPSSVYIEDENTRLNILSAQPLGVASLKEGQIEIMQDRKLFQDDNRGLDQGVADNKPTLSIFRLVVETRTPGCQEKSDSVWGTLSEKSYEAQHSLLYPVQRLIWQGDPKQPPQTYKSGPDESMNNRLHVVTAITFNSFATGLILQSSEFDTCFEVSNNYKKAVSNLYIRHLIF